MMTARNRPEQRSDSDTTRRIQIEAAKVCGRKNSRIWWAIGLIFGTMCSIAGAGAVLAINDHGALRANEERIKANSNSITEIRKTLERMDDKLDILIRMPKP